MQICRDFPLSFFFATMRKIAFIVFLLCADGLFAQSFTETLQKQVPGQGSVRIYEDDAIDVLVNGKVNAPSKASKKGGDGTTTAKKDRQTADDNISLGDNVVTNSNKTYKKRYSITGYRIQVYAGDDSRKSRQKAYAFGNKVKGLFPTVPVYTHFYSPHWICRIGDYRTYEEASGSLQQLRDTGEFKEASIIKCKIQVGY